MHDTCMTETRCRRGKAGLKTPVHKTYRCTYLTPQACSDSTLRMNYVKWETQACTKKWLIWLQLRSKLLPGPTNRPGPGNPELTPCCSSQITPPAFQEFMMSDIHRGNWIWAPERCMVLVQRIFRIVVKKVWASWEDGFLNYEHPESGHDDNHSHSRKKQRQKPAGGYIHMRERLKRAHSNP